MSKRPAVCIVYGFCEGSRMAGALLRALDEVGFEVVDDPYKADIVIGHSGGCLLVPDDLPANKIILIGLPYWPGKSLLRNLVTKNINDFKTHRQEHMTGQWARKFSWNFFYIWNVPRNLAMLRALKESPSWHAKHVTVVRNQEDSLCTPELHSLPFTHKVQFVEMPGQHDDLWMHPTQYVDLIQSYL